jgi:hypothetical protein
MKQRSGVVPKSAGLVEDVKVEGEKIRAEMATPPASPRLPALGLGTTNGAKKVVWLEIGGGWVSGRSLDFV